MIGTTVGKYRISEKLGRGGMGTVYKAVDATLDREVAIKVLNHDLADPDLLKRFRAEAVTLARLNHPGIATIYELHHHDDELVMVMEFVRGETFHNLSDRLGPLAPPQAAHLCMQVLDALGHAHRAGVVHRDLKPANLMVTESGSVKVMDFGIARVLGSEHFTHGGYMMGTPAYMAPEQVLGREIDGRADLYSVGVVFYRLLSGELPFKAETAISMVQKQISDAPTPIATFRPDLPAWCTSVIDRSLAKSPSDRFQSAEEFRSALVRAVTPQALGELPTLSTPAPPGIVFEPDLTVPPGTPVPPTASVMSTAASTPTAIARTPVASAASAPIPMSIPPAPTPTATERTTTVVLGRTHLAAMAALFVVLAAGIVMLAFAALRRGSEQPTTVTSQAAPASPSQEVASPTPAPVPTPTPAPPPASPPPTTVAPPATNPTAKPLPPAAGGVATAGAVPSEVKPKTTKPAPPGDVTTPPADLAARGGRAAGANAPPEVPAAPPPSPAPTATEQPVTFDQVRVLVTNGGRPRQVVGSLRLGDGRVSVLTAAGGSVVSIPVSSLTRVSYTRSKQPKWRDANGKEVESRIDLGPMGFLRGERNWLMFFTGGDPTILRIEDSALRTVLPAIETHTGLKVQR